MAAGAGASAQRVAEGLLPLSPDVLVENGGDIYLCSTRERNVGLLQNPEAGADLGIRLPKESFPVSICSSSATIGHSLSLGRGDLVAVRAANACLADAAATSLCNMLRHAPDLNRVLGRGKTLAGFGVQGILAIIEGNLGIWGDLELVAL